MEYYIEHVNRSLEIEKIKDDHCLSNHDLCLYLIKNIKKRIKPLFWHKEFMVDNEIYSVTIKKVEK